jgi:hypothetical protein
LPVMPDGTVGPHVNALHFIGTNVRLRQRNLKQTGHENRYIRTGGDLLLKVGEIAALGRYHPATHALQLSGS